MRKLNRMRDGYIWDKETGWYGSVRVFGFTLQCAFVCNFWQPCSCRLVVNDDIHQNQFRVNIIRHSTSPGICEKKGDFVPVDYPMIHTTAINALFDPDVGYKMCIENERLSANGEVCSTREISDQIYEIRSRILCIKQTKCLQFQMHP